MSEQPPKRTGTPHNNFFIQQLTDLKVAHSLFEEYLPAPIYHLVDWSKLRLAPKDFVQKVLENRQGDILYETRFKGKNGKEIKGFFIIHCEHQKQPEPEMIYRFLEYLASIYGQYRKQYPEEPLPIVFPMTVYQGSRGRRWTAALNFHDFLNVPEELKPYVPSFQYHLLDLSEMSDDQIKGALFVRVFLMVLKNIDSPDLLEILTEKVWPLFEKLIEEDSGLRYFEEVLRYLFKASPHLQKEKVAQQVQTILNEEAYEVIMTVAEQLEQQGMQKGEFSLLNKQLQEKFGEVPESYQDILKTLLVDELEVVGRRVITQSTLEDIFQGFSSKLS